MPAGIPGNFPAIIVAGMHRSGTSLTASLLTDAGVHLGDSLLGPGHGNPAGHFEDRDFYKLHQRVLTANGLGPEGFTTQKMIPIRTDLASEARKLVEARRRRAGLWGWKEPRTTLFLDFWAELLPEARFLLVFRRPWEVVDSLFRRGDPRFADNPSFAVDLWCHYNELIERFQQRHADRCLVVELSQIIADTAGLFARVEAEFGVTLGRPSGRFRENLLVQRAMPSWVELLKASDTGVIDLYARLQKIAGSTPTQTMPEVEQIDEVGPVKPGVAVAFAEWRRAAAAEATIAALQGDVTRLEAAAMTVPALTAERDRYSQQAEELQHQLVVAEARGSAWEAAARHARRDRDSLRANQERLTAELEQARQQLATVSADLAKTSRSVAVKLRRACARVCRKLTRELGRLGRQLQCRGLRHQSEGSCSELNR